MQFRLQTWRRISLQKSNTIPDGAYTAGGRSIIRRAAANAPRAPRKAIKAHSFLTPFAISANTSKLSPLPDIADISTEVGYSARSAFAIEVDACCPLRREGRSA
jgi:hypothetical protein